MKEVKKKPKPRPKVGDKVKIAIKPYKGRTEIGIVKNVLTKRKFHSRGHKVRLQSGTIGDSFVTLTSLLRRDAFTLVKLESYVTESLYLLLTFCLMKLSLNSENLMGPFPTKYLVIDTFTAIFYT